MRVIVRASATNLLGATCAVGVLKTSPQFRTSAPLSVPMTSQDFKRQIQKQNLEDTLTSKYEVKFGKHKQKHSSYARHCSIKVIIT